MNDSEKAARKKLWAEIRTTFRNHPHQDELLPLRFIHALDDYAVNRERCLVTCVACDGTGTVWEGA